MSGNGRPWRQPPRPQYSGVPAWGISSAAAHQEEFALSLITGVTPEWAWGGADGSGVRVCVLDSGVDGQHPFVGPLERSVGVLPGADGELVVGDVEPADLAGHGTACASIIRALAPGVTLASARVLTNGGSGSGAALLTGLAWAIEEGYDIINMSLSTAKDRFQSDLRDLTDQAYFRRCVLVCSAHNLPLRSSPWQFPSVISVASHDDSDPMTYYCNPAPPVDFYARGIRVPVAWPGGGRTVSTGNSFATPHVTAICALILSKHPHLTPFQLKSVLYHAAENVTRSARGASSERSL